MINFFVKHDFLDARNSKGFTPLSEAIWTNDYEMVKQLLLLGANVNLPICVRPPFSKQITRGETPLILAAEYGCYDIALLLLDNGAEQTPNDDGNTPLHVAAPMNLVELLVERGGDVNARNTEGETPLHCATHVGFLNYMKYLIAKGVDVSASSIYGTPLEMAIVKGRIDAMELLLEAGAKLNFDDDVPHLLEWLQDKIQKGESDQTDTIKVGELISKSISVRDLALSGDYAHFVRLLQRGEPFYMRQVLPNLPDSAKKKFMSWTHAAKRDMHVLFLLFHYRNVLTPLLQTPSPITECLKQMLMLPKQTRMLV